MQMDNTSQGPTRPECFNKNVINAFVIHTLKVQVTQKHVLNSSAMLVLLRFLSQNDVMKRV